MSYALTAITHQLLRTASVPPGTNVSMCGWVRFTTTTSNWSTIAGLEQGAQASYVYLTSNGDGTLLGVGSAGSSNAFNFTIAYGTVYFVAIAIPAAAGTINGYQSVAGAGSLTALTTQTNPTNAPTELWFGGNGSDEFLNGELYDWKVWSGGTVLTEAQFLAERDNYLPLTGQSYSANLWAHYPFVSNILDATPNGRDLGLIPTTGVLGSFTATLPGAPSAGPALTYEQFGFRWRDDNGDQASASPLAAENTGITRPILQNTRPRLLVDSANVDPPTAQRQGEWNRAAADSVWRPLEVIGGAGAAFGASGATSAATGSATAPIATYPTGITKGQQLVLFVTNKPDTVTPATPAGWTVLATATGGTGAQAADTGPTRGTLFGKEADGTETGTFTLTVTGSSSTGVKILRYTKTTGKVWALAVASGVDSTAGTAWSAAASSNPDVRAGDILLVCSAPCSDCAVASQAVSQAGVTFGALVNRENLGITTGNDTKVLMDEFPVTGGTGGTGNPTLTFTASGTGSATESGVSLFLRIRQVDAPIVLSDSANIVSGGNTATTAQLTAPGGHTFGGGDISDDTNPLPPLDIGLNQYFEDEWCIQATATALTGEVYQFRATLAGTPLTTYTQTPTWTIGASAVPASLVVSPHLMREVMVL